MQHVMQYHYTETLYVELFGAIKYASYISQVKMVLEPNKAFYDFFLSCVSLNKDIIKVGNNRTNRKAM